MFFENLTLIEVMAVGNTQIASKKPTDKQISEVKHQLEVVALESGLDSKELQRVIARGAEFQKGVKALLQDLGQLRNEYSGEIAERALGYPTGFQVPLVKEQCNRLERLYQGINLEHVKSLVEALGEKPEGADDILIRPKISYLGTHFDADKPYTTGYGQLLEVGLLPMIGKSRKFHNYRAGELTPEHIRLHSQVLARYQAIEEATPGDVVVSYFACGINPYKQEQNFSPPNFRLTALEAGDLPLCAVDIAGIILLMPDRLTKQSHLSFDCPDEYSWFGYGFESDGPCFSFRDVRLEFGARWSYGAHQRFGSPVAFGSD